MTKHVSPGISGTELKHADYKREDDGATMCWDGLGSFNAKPGSFAPKIIKPLRVKPLKKFKRRNRSFLLMSRHNIRSGITSAFRERANPDIQTCFRNGAEKYFRFPAKIFSAPGCDVPFKIFSVPGCTGTDARFMAWTPRGKFRERLPVRLPSYFALPEIIDDTEAAAFNRAKIAVYDAEFPQSKFPEHKIFGRASRNASPQYDDEPHDDINPYVLLERKQMRDAYEWVLAPQSLRVSDVLLGLAKNRKEIGRALSEDQTLDEKTYERRGKLALDETLADISKVRQILAA